MNHDSTDLYRYFDAEGRLLYVGISFSAIARAAQHRQLKGWWRDVANMTVTHLLTRRDAEQAEREAIITEKPIHNVSHSTGKAPKAPPWRCETCRKGIGLVKEDGYIQADHFDEWHVVCKSCDTGTDRYWICATRVASVTDIQRWSAHLMEKNWFDVSSWTTMHRRHCTIDEASTIAFLAFDRRRDEVRRAYLRRPSVSVSDL